MRASHVHSKDRKHRIIVAGLILLCSGQPQGRHEHNSDKKDSIFFTSNTIEMESYDRRIMQSGQEKTYCSRTWGAGVALDSP